MLQCPVMAKNTAVAKPARGWLLPNHLFARGGINYAVSYIGCVEVNTIMKVLDFETRSAIDKECIYKVCEAGGVSQSEGRRKGERKIQNILGKMVDLSRAGTNMQLTITSVCLRLSDLDSGRVIHQYEMPNICFASGGDADTLDFIAYVAKDGAGNRACYVLECGGGLAQDVVTTVVQALDVEDADMFRPPSTMPQKVVTDWIVGCLNMLNERRDGKESEKKKLASHGSVALGSRLPSSDLSPPILQSEPNGDADKEEGGMRGRGREKG